MSKHSLFATMLLFSVPGVCHSEGMSAAGWYAGSSAVVSVGSSALVSGIILSPILLPISLIITSVSKDTDNNKALVTAQAPNKKEVKMVVPLAAAEEGNLKAGDKITLEKAPQGTGALLEKDGKALAHMVTEDETSLSSNQPVPAK